VVLASEGYPDTAAPDREITGLHEDAYVQHCHAATKVINDKLMATGGRVLSVVASAKNFSEARELAYANIKNIHLEGSHFRNDIAKKVAH
jgi:phosphoribosylamine---glycine ligase